MPPWSNTRAHRVIVDFFGMRRVGGQNVFTYRGIRPPGGSPKRTGILCSSGTNSVKKLLVRWCEMHTRFDVCAQRAIY